MRSMSPRTFRSLATQRKSLISRRIRFASIRSWKSRDTRFMATRWPVTVSVAETTSPYAPRPICKEIEKETRIKLVKSF
jgi:hypothetical protein